MNKNICLHGRRGVSNLEYGLVGALIAGVAYIAVSSLGGNVNHNYCTIDRSFGASTQTTVPKTCATEQTPRLVWVGGSYTATAQSSYTGNRSDTHSTYPIGYGYLLVENLGKDSAQGLDFSNASLFGSDPATASVFPGTIQVHLSSGGAITYNGISAGMWTIAQDNGAVNPMPASVKNGSTPECIGLTSLTSGQVCVIYYEIVGYSTKTWQMPPPGTYGTVLQMGAIGEYSLPDVSLNYFIQTTMTH